MPPETKNPLQMPRFVTLLAVGSYVVIGSLYILLSDYLLNNPSYTVEHITIGQTTKGLIFIAVTATALYVILSIYLRRIQRMVHHQAQTDVALLTALERFPGPAAIYDAEGRYEFVNAFTASLIEVTEEQAIGKTTEDVAPGITAHYQLLQQAYSSGEPVSGEVTLSINGHLHYYVATFIPMTSDSGQVEHVIAWAYDISDRKHSAIQMDKQRKELRQIIDLIPNFVFAKDSKGRYLMANEAFCRFHGMAPEQILGKTTSEVLDDPVIAAEILSQDQAVLEQGKPVFRPSQIMVDYEGKRHPFQVTKIPFRTTTDNDVAVLGVALDMTERYQHEEAMNKVQERVTALVDHSLDALFVYGRDGSVTLVNQRACELLGKPREDLLHRNLLNLIAGDNIGELIQTRPPIFQDGASFQMILRSSDGREIPAEIRIGTLPGDDRDSFLAEVRDITERIRTERERLTMSRLGVDLSAARSALEVGQALYAAVQSAVPFDAFFFAVRTSGKSRFRNLLVVDTVNGEKASFPQSDFEVSPQTSLPEFYKGRPVLLLRPLDADPEPGFNAFGEKSQVSRSMVFVPIVVNSQVVATLSAQSYQVNAYTDNDLDMAQRMADMAAPALESAQANRKALIFARLGRELGAARTADDVAQVIAAMADELTGWDACLIALYSAEEDNLNYIYLADLINGKRQRVQDPQPIKRPLVFATRALQEGPFLELRQEAPAEGDYVPLTETRRPSLSMIWVPIPGENGPIGIISIQSYARNAYDNEDLETIKALAEHCGAALNRTAFQELLRYREERYRLAIESTGAVAYQLDYANKAYVFIGDQIEAITGYAPAEMNSIVWKHITLDVQLDPRTVIERDSLDRKVFKEYRAEIRIRRRDGEERWLSDQAVQLHNASGTPVGTLGIIRDITEQKRVELALRASEERYALSARGANDGLWDWDLIANTIHFSERWGQMLGIPANNLGDSPDDWFNRVHPEDVDMLQSLIDKHLIGESRHFEAEIRMHHENGDYCWMLIRGIAVRDEYNRPTRIAGSQTDITERIRTQERLLHNALHDPLTGLPNRTMLMEHLERCLNHMRRRSGYNFALVFMDLDRFKNINDSLGHLVGDQVLTTIASRLKLSVRPTDVVARFAGDEFAMVLEQVDNESEFAEIVSRVQAVLAQPMGIEHHEIITTVSAGIAIGSTDYANGEDMLRDADNALYKSKSEGAGHYCLFDSSMHEKAMKMLRLEGELRRSLERGQMRLAFQPIINVKTGNVERFEALLRWQHPEWGLLTPDHFMTIAEETGLIFGLDEWVIGEACRLLKTWDDVPFCPDVSGVGLRVNVNLSPRHFLRQVNLAERFAAIVREAGLEPGAIGLELTENALLSFRDETRNSLHELKEAGFTLYLDDFGKGYSSLSYLHNFPFDMVKIDRQFIARIQDSGPEREIVHAILVLAGKLNLGVVAEGVETARQLEIVREIGCDCAQGYFFACPETADVAINAVRESRTW